MPDEIEIDPVKYWAEPGSTDELDDGVGLT